jgi:hypothetical protein
MTQLQVYLLIAPWVLVAIAGLAVWWTSPRHRHLHPGE